MKTHKILSDFAHIFGAALLLFVVLALAGCASAPPSDKVVQPIVPAKQTVRIQESLLAECPPLPLPPAPDSTGHITEAQLVAWIKDLVNAWDVCSNMQSSLALTIRNAFNIVTDVPATKP